MHLVNIQFARLINCSMVGSRKHKHGIRARKSKHKSLNYIGVQVHTKSLRSHLVVIIKIEFHFFLDHTFAKNLYDDEKEIFLW